MLIALSLWLCGNGWWMCGDVGISGNNNKNAPEAAYILVAALAWILLHHVLLRPLGLMRVSQSTIAKYKGTGLRPRFTYFVTWRGYEHAHSFFWAAKVCVHVSIIHVQSPNLTSSPSFHVLPSPLYLPSPITRPYPPRFHLSFPSLHPPLPPPGPILESS